MKTLVVIILFAIIASLFSAAWALTRKRQPSDKTKLVKALSIRIGLSLTLFIMLLIAASQGWITPQGSGTVQPTQASHN